MFKVLTRQFLLSLLWFNFGQCDEITFKDQPIKFIERYFKPIIPQLETCTLVFVTEEANSNHAKPYINQGIHQTIVNIKIC